MLLPQLHLFILHFFFQNLGTRVGNQLPLSLLARHPPPPAPSSCSPPPPPAPDPLPVLVVRQLKAKQYTHLLGLKWANDRKREGEGEGDGERVRDKEKERKKVRAEVGSKEREMDTLGLKKKGCEMSKWNCGNRSSYLLSLLFIKVLQKGPYIF